MTLSFPETKLKSSRIVWIESLKGVTVLFVLIHHVTLASQSWLLTEHSTYLPYVILKLDNILSSCRMPAFFLCSGFVFAANVHKGTSWLINKRIMGASWVILAWTAISYMFELSGVQLIPWRDGFFSIRQAIWSPIGVLWFMYALMICSISSFFVGNLSAKNQILISLILSLLAAYLGGEIKAPQGIENTLNGLGTSGFFFFMTGAALGKVGVRTMVNQINFLKLSTLSVVAIMIHSAFGNENLLQELFGLRIPSTIIFIIIIALFTEKLAIFRKVFSFFGSISLQIFLTHQFIITLSLSFWENNFEGNSSIVTWTALVLLAIFGTLILQHFVYRLSGGLAFRPPKWFTAPMTKNTFGAQTS